MNEYQYDMDYSEQPNDEWLLCPWHNDAEKKRHKKGIYAKKCVCPNCVYHIHTKDNLIGSVKRWCIDNGVISNRCYICKKNSCSSEQGNCGWAGRITSIRVE